jgi:alpha-glucosidase
MRMNNTLLILLLIFLFSKVTAQDFQLLSPDKKIQLTVHTRDKLSYDVTVDGKNILAGATLGMVVNNDIALGTKAKVKKTEKKTVDESVNVDVPTRARTVRNNYNELAILFNDNYSVAFRVFNDGVAYRFITGFKDSITVKTEEADFNFAGNYTGWFHEDKSFFSSYERPYVNCTLKDFTPERFAGIPALVDTKDNVKVAITETDLEDYCGMWLSGAGSNSLKAVFPKYPVAFTFRNDRSEEPTERATYLAKTKGTRSFPWRILALVRSDAELFTNQLPFLLAKPNQVGDVSWIKPGKVAWDWWNDNNVYDVGFRAGVNTETYKYNIDFAAKYGIEYIIIDEGWSELRNLLQLTSNINLEEVISYGKQKNVGVILWVIWKTLDIQMEAALDNFVKLGAKGIKVDFMDRDDQPMVNYYWRVARECAKRKLLVDFHGAYKPAGLHRAYPNVINYEGVRGNEYNKFADDITPKHTVTFPFLRMWAGPLDFTPGSMNNVNMEYYKTVFNNPFTMGTRCNQMAMFVIYEAPLQMLCDNATNYYKEPDCTGFIAKVPVTWDDTRVFDAKISEYIALARKKGNEWFVGCMTNPDARELTLDFSFLDEGRTYNAEIFQDGINADRNAKDYKKVTQTLKKGDKLTVKLAPGGGWVARIY